MSKTRPWMPMYWGDLISDTMHLGPTEFGIYMRLLAHCWQHGCIPRDDRRLCLISQCDSRLWWQYRETVLQFFDVVDASTMQQRRVSTELRRYEEISNKRKGAALQKHVQKLCKTDANAGHLHTHPHPHPHRIDKKEKTQFNGNGVKRIEKQKPKHCQKSKNGRIWCDVGTMEFTAYAEDYSQAHLGEAPKLDWNGSGAWFNLSGESR